MESDALQGLRHVLFLMVYPHLLPPLEQAQDARATLRFGRRIDIPDLFLFGVYSVQQVSQLFGVLYLSSVFIM